VLGASPEEVRRWREAGAFGSPKRR
jgi:hypothetical protein